LEVVVVEGVIERVGGAVQLPLPMVGWVRLGVVVHLVVVVLEEALASVAASGWEEALVVGGLVLLEVVVAVV
jgi:hypothetical protein